MRITSISKFLITLFAIYLVFRTFIMLPKPWIFLDNVDLAIHEFGHFLYFLMGIFIPSLLRSAIGHFLQIAAGTFMQLFIPLIFLFYFWYKYDDFGVYSMLFWFGQSLVNVSVYAADAICKCLPLVGDGVTHDWNFMLSTLGILRYTPQIGSTIQILGFVIMLIAIFNMFKRSVAKLEVVVSNLES